MLARRTLSASTDVHLGMRKFDRGGVANACLALLASESSGPSAPWENGEIFEGMHAQAIAFRGFVHVKAAVGLDP